MDQFTAMTQNKLLAELKKAESVIKRRSGTSYAHMAQQKIWAIHAEMRRRAK